MPEIDFEAVKKIYEIVKDASEVYTIKSFKPWISDGGKSYITIQLIKKE